MCQDTVQCTQEGCLSLVVQLSGTQLTAVGIAVSEKLQYYIFG